MSRSRVSLAIVLAVGFASLSAVLIRLSNEDASTIAAWRMIIASVILLVPTLRAGRTRGSMRRGVSQRRDYLTMGLSGLFLAAHFWAWISAVQQTSIAHATVLVSTHPVFVIVAGYGTGVRPSRRTLGAVAGALAGVVLLSVGGGRGGIAPTVRGDLLAVAAAAAVSGYLLIGRSVRSRVDATTYNYVVYTVAAVALLAISLVSRQFVVRPSLRELAIFFALALFCTIFGHGTLNWALRHVAAHTVSLNGLLEPVYATAMAAVAFREYPSPASVVGGAVVVLTTGWLVVRPTETRVGGG